MFPYEIDNQEQNMYLFHSCTLDVAIAAIVAVADAVDVAVVVVVTRFLTYNIKQQLRRGNSTNIRHEN